MDMDMGPPPNLVIRLEGVEGLDDPGASPSEPLAFHLAVDARGVPQHYHACGGGGTSMLRVSYHGMILAWGHVPWFWIRGGRSSNSLATTVIAKAEGAVLREDVRGLVLSEKHVWGKAEFDVEGEVARLGYLRCKAFLFEGKAEEAKATCQVQ
ncbi:unnamed protein product [Urochloa decumbens]|uniref:Uncharacterized protein n=1 Tax=Urochloa decumbens TaxID=240449 RepID=A0ABC8ZLT9_9POAL